MKTTLKSVLLCLLVIGIFGVNAYAQDGLNSELSIHSALYAKGLKPSQHRTEPALQNNLKIQAPLSTEEQKNAMDIWERSFDLDKYYPRRGTQNFVNIYLGLNNWLEDGDLPSSDMMYSLSPIKSWYFGINFDNVSRILGPLYLDWGLGASFQDYAFENARVRVIKEPDAIDFGEVVDITGRKSKINVGYLNVHFVPTFSFGQYRDFRVGFGVYGGYRISSNTKMKFDDATGDKQKDKINDSFHINPFKYGFRATVGWDSFDMFFNYDLTEFFDEDINAPRLTPVTFGIIF